MTTRRELIITRIRLLLKRALKKTPIDRFRMRANYSRCSAPVTLAIFSRILNRRGVRRMMIKRTLNMFHLTPRIESCHAESQSTHLSQRSRKANLFMFLVNLLLRPWSTARRRGAGREPSLDRSSKNGFLGKNREIPS